MVEILRDVVQGFSEAECENLRNALAEGHRGRVWRSDATLLRQNLEEDFVKSYREAEQEIAKLEIAHLPEAEAAPRPLPPGLAAAPTRYANESDRPTCPSSPP